MSSGLVGSYINPLIILNAIKYQKAEIIELHFDLEGSGWEEKKETTIAGYLLM